MESLLIQVLLRTGQVLCLISSYPASYKGLPLRGDRANGHALAREGRGGEIMALTISEVNITDLTFN